VTVHDVIVVGCGPTGIAALIEARRRGLVAVGLEAGPAPVASLSGYLNGLVLLSDATHFEVGGLPLDCVDRTALLREEVLSYFARALAHEGLDTRARHRVVALEPDESGVTVRAQTPHEEVTLRARSVLVAAWYGVRPLPRELLDPSGRTAVHQRVGDVATLPGRDLVIVGGGVSAFEHAVAATLAGKRVTVVARGPVARSFRDAAFRQLVATTNVEVFPNARGICTNDGAVEFELDGTRYRRACEAVIASIGFEILPDVARMLREIGAIEERELALLGSARGPDGWRRARPTILQEQLIPLLVEERPDLQRLVYRGHRRVHVAGGALHVGGPDAGVATSIRTAEIAIRAMAGVDQPMNEDTALHASLLEWALTSEDPPPSFEHLAEIRPLVRPPRRSASSHRESKSGFQDLRARSSGGAPADLVALCDGTRSVAAISALRASSGDAARDSVVAALVEGFRDGTLTWLPRAVA
jgi:thioredoxin reductase